jgi:hypothetical protein
MCGQGLLGPRKPVVPTSTVAVNLSPVEACATLQQHHKRASLRNFNIFF